MPKICKVDGCNRPVKGLGFCSKHYQRYKRNGHTDLIIEYGGPRADHPAEYKCWDSMRQRCLNEKHTHYDRYGGRGIRICQRWQGAHGFATFLSDMGPMPSHDKTIGNRYKYSIDRIDVNGDYCPENCRWATWSEQACNRSNSTNNPGVTLSGNGKSWLARYRSNGYNLSKRFNTKKEAIIQRMVWEKKYHP